MAERVNGILLDTSVVVAHLRGRIDLQNLAAADEPLFLPLVALGELYRGVLKSARPEFNRATNFSKLQRCCRLMWRLLTSMRGSPKRSR